MSTLNNAVYMKFPFQIADGAVLSTRLEHVRQTIEQVLFTHHAERWYRPEFGVGIVSLVFEPNSLALRELTKKRLMTSLTDALAGEVDPRTLTVDVVSEDEKLYAKISYTLAALNHTERQEFLIG